MGGGEIGQRPGSGADRDPGDAIGLVVDVRAKRAEHQPEQDREQRRREEKQKGAGNDGRDQNAAGEDGGGGGIGGAYVAWSMMFDAGTPLATHAKCRIGWAVAIVSLSHTHSS